MCDQINKKQRASALMRGRNEDLVCMQHSGRYSLVRFELEMMRIPKKYIMSGSNKELFQEAFSGKILVLNGATLAHSFLCHYPG